MWQAISNSPGCTINLGMPCGHIFTDIIHIHRVMFIHLQYMFQVSLQFQKPVIQYPLIMVHFMWIHLYNLQFGAIFFESSWCQRHPHHQFLQPGLISLHWLWNTTWSFFPSNVPYSLGKGALLALRDVYNPKKVSQNPSLCLLELFFIWHCIFLHTT